MSTTAQPRQPRRKPLPHDPDPSDTRPTNTMQRVALWNELTRRRALLLADAHLSLFADKEPETQPDPIDQASQGFGQDLAIQVRIRTFDQLRRVEHALQLMRTDGYGRCHRCHEEIPHKRLMVKPDTLFCVHCLTLIEQGTTSN